MDKDLEALIAQLKKEKGGQTSDYEQLMDKIAFHESKSNPVSKQIGGGPGRGLFQFEEGIHQGGITAAKRLKSYLAKNNKPTPEWLSNATKAKTLDASTLSPSQQKMLFLGNLRNHPKADIGTVISGKEKLPEFWAKYHWSGPSSQKQARLNSFNSSMDSYSKTHESARDVHNKVREMKQATPAVQVDTSNKTPNSYASGGLMGYIKDKDLNTFEGGGTHEQNPLGGIPQGKGSNGKTNTVEEGEASYNIGDMKFIFTNRIKIQ